MVGEFKNTVTRCKAFLIIVQMRNAINIGVKIVFRTTRFSQTGQRAACHSLGSPGLAQIQTTTPSSYVYLHIYTIYIKLLKLGGNNTLVEVDTNRHLYMS